LSPGHCLTAPRSPTQALDRRQDPAPDSGAVGVALLKEQIGPADGEYGGPFAVLIDN
jgi:hypothetical protein